MPKDIPIEETKVGRFMAVSLQRKNSDGQLTKPSAGPVLIRATVDAEGYIVKADYDMVISAREITKLSFTDK